MEVSSIGRVPQSKIGPAKRILHWDQMIWTDSWYFDRADVNVNVLNKMYLTKSRINLNECQNWPWAWSSKIMNVETFHLFHSLKQKTKKMKVSCHYKKSI